MPELDFAVDSAAMVPHAAAPLLLFKLRLTNTCAARPVENVMLNCQIRIEATRRHYGQGDHERLVELFGAAERWSRTLHSILWTHAVVLAPPFERECAVDLPVPCSYDFNVAATKYFYGLEDGEVPLLLLFSGSVFYRSEDGRLQIGQLARSKEAAYRLPVRVWQAMMDHYYPDSAWLRLGRGVFDRIYGYKRENGLPTWDHALEHLLDARSAEARR